jgi:hypothetical protein
MGWMEKEGRGAVAIIAVGLKDDRAVSRRMLFSVLEITDIQSTARTDSPGPGPAVLSPVCKTERTGCNNMTTLTARSESIPEMNASLDPKPQVFARRTFFWSGTYGLATLVPQYFLRGTLDHLFPPALNHPEHFYGFVGVAIAWQLAFIAISRDPARLRPLMPAAMAEKLLFAMPALALAATSRASPALAVPALIDLVLAAFFFVSYRRSQPHGGPPRLPSQRLT